MRARTRATSRDDYSRKKQCVTPIASTLIATAIPPRLTLNLLHYASSGELAAIEFAVHLLFAGFPSRRRRTAFSMPVPPKWLQSNLASYTNCESYYLKRATERVNDARGIAQPIALWAFPSEWEQHASINGWRMGSATPVHSDFPLWSTKYIRRAWLADKSCVTFFTVQPRRA